MIADNSQTTISMVKMIDISDVKNNYLTLLESSFAPEEREELASRHIRSTAGVLALKKALAALINEITNHSVNIRDCHISRSKTGAPVLLSLPEQLNRSPLNTSNVFVSISHSRQTACGLAVYQEETDG